MMERYWRERGVDPVSVWLKMKICVAVEVAVNSIVGRCLHTFKQPTELHEKLCNNQIVSPVTSSHIF